VEGKVCEYDVRPSPKKRIYLYLPTTFCVLEC